MLSKDHAKDARELIDPAKAACDVKPSTLDGLTDSGGGDTIYLSVIDKDGNIVSLIQSLYVELRQRRRAAGHRLHAAQPRRALHAATRRIRTCSRRASARCTRSSRRSWKRAT